MVVRRPDLASGEVHRAPPDVFKEFLKYIKADRSLFPNEEPGTDCLRQARDFPKLKWWKENSWRAHIKASKGSSKIGKSTGNLGKTHAANGENVSCLYIEDADGVAVDGHCIRRLREFAANTLMYMKEQKLLLGVPRWEEVDVRVRETCVDALRRKWPELQACEDNWKTHVFMKEAYYENIVRPPRPSKKMEPDAVSLDNAQYVVDDRFSPSPIDEDPPPSLLTITAATCSSAPRPKPRPKRKSPPASETSGAGPSKRPNLAVVTDFDHRASEAISGAKSSVPDIGLRPASHDDAVPHPRHIELQQSNTQVDVCPPSPSAQHPALDNNADINNTPQHPARDENADSNDAMDDANASNENRAEGSTVLPPTGKGKKRVPVDIPRTTDDLTHRVLSNPSAIPTAPAMPSAGSERATSTSTARNAPSGTTKTGPAQAKGKAKAGKPKPKSGASSTAKVWPPLASEKQPKWVYGRDDWLKANPNGTLEEFENHYTNELKENERRKISRDQK
ncbi:hypothetical protein TRAPUB_11885, partial [Trametes pubescens]